MDSHRIKREIRGREKQSKEKEVKEVNEEITETR